MSHTPGPWRVDGSVNLGNTIQGYCGRKQFDGDDGYRTIACYQSCEPTGNYYAEKENAEANARLIAAAPDLLALVDGVYDEPAIAEGIEWRRRARAVLARVRGEG